MTEICFLSGSFIAEIDESGVPIEENDKTLDKEEIIEVFEGEKFWDKYLGTIPRDEISTSESDDNDQYIKEKFAKFLEDDKKSKNKDVSNNYNNEYYGSNRIDTFERAPTNGLEKSNEQNYRIDQANEALNRSKEFKNAMKILKLIRKCLRANGCRNLDMCIECKNILKAITSYCSFKHEQREDNVNLKLSGIESKVNIIEEYIDNSVKVCKEKDKKIGELQEEINILVKKVQQIEEKCDPKTVINASIKAVQAATVEAIAPIASRLSNFETGINGQFESLEQQIADLLRRQYAPT